MKRPKYLMPYDQWREYADHLEAQNAELLEALKGWRTAFIERVEMKVTDKHKNWFIRLTLSSSELIENAEK